jgi:transcriptional regulator of nitric oxide reductase
MLVGIDPEGVVRGLKLVEHKEPIVLVGVPEKRVVEAINRLTGCGSRPSPLERNVSSMRRATVAAALHRILLTLRELRPMARSRRCSSI